MGEKYFVNAIQIRVCCRKVNAQTKSSEWVRRGCDVVKEENMIVRCDCFIGMCVEMFMGGNTLLMQYKNACAVER